MDPDDAQPTGEPDEPRIPLQDLLGIGADEPPAPPGPDDLRAIVARAGRRRRQVTAVGVVAALAAGAAIGYGVSNHGSSAVQTASSSANASSSTTVAGYGSVSTGSVYSTPVATLGGPPSLAGPTLTPIFHRTTAGITIRGFLSSVSLPRLGLLPRCTISFGPNLQAEVSTAKMVGTVGGGVVPGAPNSSVMTIGVQLIGVAEGDPTAVVTVQTSSAVTRLRMQFAGGKSDEMAPVKGWAALAASAPGLAGKSNSVAVGQLTAYNAAGHVLSTNSVNLGYQMFGGGVSNMGGVPTLSPGCEPCPPPLPKSSSAPVGAPKVVPSPAAGSSVNPGGPMISDTTIPANNTASSGAAVGSAVGPFACAGVKPGSGGVAGGGKSTGTGSSAGQPPMTGTVVPATGSGQPPVTETTAPPVTGTTVPTGTPTTASSGPATGGSTTSAAVNQ